MAPGFEPAVETVVFENDITMNVVLTKPAPAAGPVTGERSLTAAAPATKAAPAKPTTAAAVPAPLIVVTPPPAAAPPPPTSAASAPVHKVAKPAIDDGDPWIKR